MRSHTQLLRVPLRAGRYGQERKDRALLYITTCDRADFHAAKPGGCPVMGTISGSGED
jgi:hypothetical protein